MGIISDYKTFNYEQTNCYSFCCLIIILLGSIEPQAQEKQLIGPVEDSSIPIIANGQTQIIPRFEDPDMWIHHDLWVETEFDSDGGCIRQGY